MMLLFTAMLSVADCDNDLMAGLKSSEAIILRLDFDTWKSEIDPVTEGFDERSQQYHYASYLEELQSLEAFFKDEKIACRTISDRASIPTKANAYLVDFDMGIWGEEMGYMLFYGGFFFHDLKNGCISNQLGTVQLVKSLKRNIKKGRVAFAPIECGYSALRGVEDTEAILLKLDFDKWKSEIALSQGLDNSDLLYLYAKYIKSIQDYEAFFKDEKIKATVITDRSAIPVGTDVYLLDYTLKERETRRDEKTPTDGFFFQSLNNGCRTKYLGTVRKHETRRKIIMSKRWVLHN